MKKKLFLRGALGFPIGIAIGYVITICISLRWAGGYYPPCVPELAEALGSEIGAVALQALLCGLLGVGFAASSVIWEMESWSIARQTGVYFFIISLIMLPIAYVAYWMEHSVAPTIHIGSPHSAPHHVAQREASLLPIPVSSKPRA